MEFKGTKGQWEYDDEIHEDGCYEVGVPDGAIYWIAKVNAGLLLSKEEAEANAKAISAVPNMIAAIQYALEFLGHAENDYAVGEGNIKDSCKALQAAIEKALK